MGGFLESLINWQGAVVPPHTLNNRPSPVTTRPRDLTPPVQTPFVPRRRTRNVRYLSFVSLFPKWRETIFSGSPLIHLTQNKKKKKKKMQEDPGQWGPIQRPLRKVLRKGCISTTRWRDSGRWHSGRPGPGTQ